MNIKLSINIFLILILFFITNQLEIYVLIMVFAFIHEVTHLICGIILGFRPYNFKIMPVGFGVEFIIPIRNYNKKVFKSNILSIKKIIIAISGPLINCIIAFWGITSNINSNMLSGKRYTS